MKTLKVIVAVALLAVITVACTLSAQAVNIDGYAGNSEWEESKTYFLDEYKAYGNSIKYAYAKISVDEKANCLYILVCSEFKAVQDPQSNEAMTLTVNGSAPIVVNFDSTFAPDFPYEGETATAFDFNTKTCFTETSIRFKQGFIEKNIIKLSICDTQGEYSNEFVLEYDLHGEFTPQEEDEAPTQKAAKSIKSKASSSKKGKASKTQKTDFPFKKVENTEENQTAVINGQEEQVSLQPQELNTELKSKSGGEKLIYSVAGALGALAVIGSAVLVSVKNSKKNQEKS